MSKICPICKQVHEDEDVICGYGCGVRLVPMQEVPNSTLNLGDANAISGGININQSKNITSHDIHYHTSQERNKSEKELTQERQNQYHDEVAKLLKNGIITVEARAQLDGLRFNLGLDAATASSIEAVVKNEQKTQARATNDGLSVIGKMALKSAITAVEQNNPQAQSCIVKLAPVCKSTMNEQVHFYYSMLMSAFDPQRCVETYEKRTVDSYWLSYWASVAYRKLGDEEKAESILMEMTALWQDRPEINVVINACVGIWIAAAGNLEECRDTIIEYLTQTDEAPSEELNDLFHALLYQVGIEETDNDRFAFYEQQFLMVTAADYDADMEKAKAAYDQKDYAEALDILKKWAEKGDAEAMRMMGRSYLNGTGMEKKETIGVKWIKEAAELGNAKAIRDMGLSYEFGRGVKKDFAEAVKCYRNAAELGDAIAMSCLGTCYGFGKGVDKDDKEAVEWYRKAAEQGEAIAQGYLGHMYEIGRGVEQNDAEAAKWYRKAAEQGNANAQNSLGLMYECGRGVDQNDKEAVKWYSKAAEQGNADAQNSVGRMYQNGRGVDQNDKEAVKWYSKAAEQGNARAQCNLGWMYEDGRGVDQNDKEAVKWYRKAAEQGHAFAQNYLGVMYQYGRGVEQNDVEAVNWYRQAAEQGDAYAQYNLGLMYRNGQGVEQNDTEAVMWFRNAAGLGNDNAMTDLGVCYFRGWGAAKNPQEAIKWFQKAADLGNDKAMNCLGFCYDKGIGATRNYIEAIKWYQKAADLGNDFAMNNSGRLYHNGEEAARDQTEALKWHKKAAELGNVPAMADLSKLLFEMGRFDEAIGWGQKALDNGFNDKYGEIERIINSK